MGMGESTCLGVKRHGSWTSSASDLMCNPGQVINFQDQDVSFMKYRQWDKLLAKVLALTDKYDQSLTTSNITVQQCGQ